MSKREEYDFVLLTTTDADTPLRDRPAGKWLMGQLVGLLNECDIGSFEQFIIICHLHDALRDPSFEHWRAHKEAGTLDQYRLSTHTDGMTRQ